MSWLLGDFLVRAGLAACGVALAAALPGCFVVWRRMAYFGDATAHAAILGVALSLAVAVPIFAGVLVVAGGLGVIVATLGGRTQGIDSLLGVLAHGSLALGLVAVSVLPPSGLALEAYLFGDILAVGVGDLAVIWGGGALVWALIAWRWSALLTATISGELAFADGIDPRRERLVLTVALALVVAVSIKVVGALLITAMLIIPAAAARPLARTPEGMAAIASLLAVAAALGGLQLAWLFDTPAGPTIVAAAAAIFAATAVIRLVRGS